MPVTNFNCLHNFLGKLEEVPKFLELAENASSRATLDAGFNFCKGTYEW